jgi:lipoprotein NlpD
MVNREWCMVCLLLFLTACNSRDGLAPVVDLRWHPMNKQEKHIVRQGETLYSIAWRYDKDYRELAAANHIASPYLISIGQPIRLSTKKRIENNKSGHNINNKVLRSWIWPARGKIVNTFTASLNNKGIDIAGKRKSKILATQSGKVAYAGNGLSGYGNLIIIKHNQEYLSAYAHNKKLLVKEGQWVKAGDIIAEMGNISRNKWGVHFEIRKAGKPVDPLNYLKKQV